MESLISPVVTNTYTYTTSPTSLLDLRVALGSAIVPPGVGELSVNDVSTTEGDSGTTDATFTVTLSPSAVPAPARGATPAGP